MFWRDVVPGVHRGEDANTNWYLLQEGDRLTLVDAGVPASRATLHEGLRQLGLPLGAIEALVLTHAHFDHVGIAERLRCGWSSASRCSSTLAMSSSPSTR